MRYLTHQFAHLETLERARRWLVHAGFDPAQIHVTIDGIPRIAVLVAPGQAAEAGLIIDAAELADPEGLPSFWDLARPASRLSRSPRGDTNLSRGPGIENLRAWDIRCPMSVQTS